MDSSGWLEYVTDQAKAEDFAPYIEGRSQILVPAVVLYEVYKKLWMSRGKTEADRFASQALRRQVVPLDEAVALAAATVSLEHRLGMADAVIYATVLMCEARLVTSDPDFRGLAGVELI